MSLHLCILASGSSGNCAALRTPGGVVLIDLGLLPRPLKGRLGAMGIHFDDVRAICLTHLDHDHFRPAWLPYLATRAIGLHCDIQRRRDVLSQAADENEASLLDDCVRGFDGQSFEPLTGLKVETIPLAHDSTGSHAFIFSGFGCRIGYATDLGHVPQRLIERFCDLDILAIESNYDPIMQEQSPRPFFLKRRITGGRGHLSNEQARDAVSAVFDRCEKAGKRLPRHVVLLHRSQQCNSPEVAQQCFASDPRIPPRLVLANAYTPTKWMGPCSEPLPGEQLTLAFG